jgi:hypothetical protein
MVLHEEAWTALAASTPAKQRRILQALELLKNDPFKAGILRNWTLPAGPTKFYCWTTG